ncbi:Uncharacterised protein [Vibrio cholerae]|uniref:Uncharacterized protein n=1 Tax=Vibrio cholerae TaxID=666 RepID=A0A656AGV7_VIBCL|nr:Uncharacterised protein [Vibrio cholerae]
MFDLQIAWRQVSTLSKNHLHRQIISLKSKFCNFLCVSCHIAQILLSDNAYKR